MASLIWSTTKLMLSGNQPMSGSCEICGATRGLDRHHVVPRSMGGSKNPVVQDEANLMTLCRQCHRNLHEGRWRLVRSQEGIRVLDSRSGEEIMRRLYKPGLDIPSLFHLLNLAEDSLSRLLEAMPYISDDQLVEAFAYACSFGKRSWLVQAAILYEAQQRSTYGERTLEAIARRFEIGIRQAQKYALVWKVFFTRQSEGESVNIDAIVLDEPSWYVVAATETKEAEKWLAYAQDRKMEDPRYSVVAFRRDIRWARLIQGIGDAKEVQWPDAKLTMPNSWTCPWVKVLCTQSGKPIPFRECRDCEFNEKLFCETNPTLTEG